jgi:hypothetical protein
MAITSAKVRRCAQLPHALLVTRGLTDLILRIAVFRRVHPTPLRSHTVGTERLTCQHIPGLANTVAVARPQVAFSAIVWTAEHTEPMCARA